MKYYKTIMVALALGISVPSYAASRADNYEMIGGALGGAAGAAIGTTISNTRTGAILGAAVGGLTGVAAANAINKRNDEEDSRNVAYYRRDGTPVYIDEVRSRDTYYRPASYDDDERYHGYRSDRHDNGRHLGHYKHKHKFKHKHKHKH